MRRAFFADTKKQDETQKQKEGKSMKKQIFGLVIPALAALILLLVPSSESRAAEPPALPAYAEVTGEVPAARTSPDAKETGAPAAPESGTKTETAAAEPVTVEETAPAEPEPTAETAGTEPEPPEPMENVPTEPMENVPTEPEPTAATAAETVAAEPDKLYPLPEYPQNAAEAAVYINGSALPGGLGAAIGGEIYFPVGAFDFYLGSGSGIEAEDGDAWVRCGERCIPCSLRDLTVTARDFGAAGEVCLCVPVRVLASASGLGISCVENGSGGVTVSFFGVPTYPTAAEVYGADDLYWLSRIISAEARGEPFAGQLAVGAVVMNRVRSRYYPGTVEDVIFDRKFGVQFSPAYSGSINRAPTDSCVTAAKLTLEGFSVSDTILFFFNSKISAGSWITSSRTYTLTIGNHDFYS